MPTNNNMPILDRKEWQMMTPTPTASVAAAFISAWVENIMNDKLYVVSATVQYLYHVDEDAFVQVTSWALAGTFGAGACWIRHPWSIAYTANGWSTTTITVAAATHNITWIIRWKMIECVSWTAANIWQRRKVTAIKSVDWGTWTITLTLDRALPSAVVSTDTFRASTGRHYVMSAGTTALWSWKTFDVATMAWQANLSITGFPATWATDWKIALQYHHCDYDVAWTAISWSTTTLVDTSKNMDIDAYKDFYLFCTDWTWEWQTVKITGNTATTFSFSAVTTAFDSTSVYEVLAHRKPAFWKATGWAASTLTNSAKTWTVNQWTNFQIRIISGTGFWQVRTIASNTGTVITTSAAWTTIPDTTSVYMIEWNENFLYVAGNAAATMYKYSISWNTWATMAPTTARSAAPSTGMNLAIVDDVDDVWHDESDFRNMRYLYSLRGWASVAIDRFDIAWGTAGAGAWQQITYNWTETFTTGSSVDMDGRYMYIRKDATNRFFKFAIRGNYMEPLSTLLYTDWAALLWNKIFIQYYDKLGAVKWLYSLRNTWTELHRMMIF